MASSGKCTSPLIPRVQCCSVTSHKHALHWKLHARAQRGPAHSLRVAPVLDVMFVALAVASRRCAFCAIADVTAVLAPWRWPCGWLAATAQAVLLAPLVPATRNIRSLQAVVGLADGNGAYAAALIANARREGVAEGSFDLAPGVALAGAPVAHARDALHSISLNHSPNFRSFLLAFAAHCKISARSLFSDASRFAYFKRRRCCSRRQPRCRLRCPKRRRPRSCGHRSQRHG